MDPRQTPEYTLEISADRASLKEIVKGVLHTIFFHRYFTALYPATHDVLDLTLPYVSEADVESLIEERSAALLQQLDRVDSQHTSSYVTKVGRGQLSVQFSEKKRRKGWFTSKTDEETVWEIWVLNVTLIPSRNDTEFARNRKQMERNLQTTILKIAAIASRERNHIPPITTNDTNPFPYHIFVSPKHDQWGSRINIF